MKHPVSFYSLAFKRFFSVTPETKGVLTGSLRVGPHFEKMCVMFFPVFGRAVGIFLLWLTLTAQSAWGSGKTFLVSV